MTVCPLIFDKTINNNGNALSPKMQKMEKTLEAVFQRRLKQEVDLKELQSF